jgi:hypothetical protein
VTITVLTTFLGVVNVRNSRLSAYLKNKQGAVFCLKGVNLMTLVSDTELFALDVNDAVQLLSSFDGTVVFPKTETKGQIFTDAVDNSTGKLIPNGTYKFRKKKMSDNKVVTATADVDNGRWTLLKGSVLGMVEDVGVSQKAKAVRASLPLDTTGKLLEDYDLGECSPSHAGAVVMNQSNNGWDDWKNSQGQPVKMYRTKASK